MRKARLSLFLRNKKASVILNTLSLVNLFGGEDLFFLLVHLSLARGFMAIRHENRGEQNKVTSDFFLSS